MTFIEVVNYLERLTIMPKTMPGLEKIRAAVIEKKWFHELDSKKIITVAGTNGKGTTCAVLESLLLSAGQKVGLYTSPHLIQTTERIRVHGKDISEVQFVQLFLENQNLIEKHQLSHFEALTLMASDHFFQSGLDYVIFEVGLGGTYDATNIFPNYYSVITKLGLDHQNILGNTLIEVAQNKFGIVKTNSIIVHHQLPEDVQSLKKSDATWIQAKTISSRFENNQWFLDSVWGVAEVNIPGERTVENAATALTLFEVLGFNPQNHLSALSKIRWQGRMQKINWPGFACPLYLSGDHNIQGVESLIQILSHYDWNELHLVVGIGQDKSCEEMFSLLLNLPRVQIYLTETPFKGRPIDQYPEEALKVAIQKNTNCIEILNSIRPNKNDLVVVTGSLYLVGDVLKYLKSSLGNLYE
jgi:dihydrofolate synthase/folylpolyglutamate synthase